jgi:uncharacterized lipoprotein YddW (UPF0748 family)
MSISIRCLFYFLLISLTLGACKSQKKALPPAKTQTPIQKITPKPTPSTTTIPAKPIPEASLALKTISHTLPEIPREFRGVWIATVANIDWPASGLDSYEKQKKDFIAILDYYKKLNFNAVIVQIRTAGDAFYPSKYAPWSKYLTGKEGQAPQTQENPLTWMIQEAHSRGLEFHAWLNPYRATFDLKTDLLSPNHDFHKHRDWMVKYGPKYYYNPGLPEVKNHLTAVIKEIVDNYDIDAIHFDDYFYPYKIAKETFPDQTTYNKFKNQGQTQDDWRRQNVNDLIQAVHTTIKTSKPWVQFGISPFGVWRNQAMDPKGSPTRAGQTNYDDLYADPMTWMKNGWIDYLIPQVYWSMEHPLASYRKLNDWWSNNSHGTNIYIGNGPYKIREDSDTAWKIPTELNSQVYYSRTLPTIQGNAFFSAKSLFAKNQDVANQLKNELYNKPTLPPAFEPKSTSILEIPVVLNVESTTISTKISLEKPLDPAIRYGMVQGSQDLNLLHEAVIHPVWVGGSRARSIEVPSINTEFLAIRWIDHFGRIVQTQVYQIPKSTQP